MLQTVDFNSSLQCSLHEFSVETFDELEERANREIVTKTLSFEDLVLTFLLEVQKVKKESRVSCKFVARRERSFF